LNTPSHFSETICKRLGYYVYRLIDPRDGSTFYVGRGQNNRVFEHAAGKSAPSEGIENLKLKTIREIKDAGLEVQHVIHRHGMDEKCVREVEAALIDAFPGLTNITQSEGECGVMHAHEVITLYDAPVAELQHKLLLINVNRSEHHDLLDAVRLAWKIDRERASKAEYVLAVRRGLIIGAFRPKEWLPATEENFPTLYRLVEANFGPIKDRYGFNGEEASEDIKKHYCQKRVPDAMKARGAINPVRYWNM
jgi:hypothetical protein